MPLLDNDSTSYYGRSSILEEVLGLSTSFLGLLLRRGNEESDSVANFIVELMSSLI